jgi:subtilisin family serine protease
MKRGIFGARWILLIALTLPSTRRANPAPLEQTSFPPVVEEQGKQTEAEVDVLENDPAIARNWGLQALAAQRSWRISRGSRQVIVAVIDTGIDVAHPALAENIWKNAGETGLDSAGRDQERNGKDDDGNGFIDDVHGWNFSSGNNDVRDNHGHGTHISGIIDAVSPRVSIMALKYFEPSAPTGDAVDNTVAAIRYAVRMGAHIINYSAGGLSRSDEEKAAIREAGEHGVLVVAAAGNERSNSDIIGYYPADYDLSNILSVTALDPARALLPSSNFGTKTVDLAAPGQNIYSTLPGGRYGSLSGTSQATAFATGVAALVMAKNNLYRAPEKLIENLVRTGDPDGRLIGKTKYRVSLNSYRALAIEETGVAAAGERAANTASMNQNWFAARGQTATAQLAEIAALAQDLETLAPDDGILIQRGPAASLGPLEARPK